MPSTDVRVQHTRAAFTEVRLDPPFVISGRSMTSYTLAMVEATVTNRAGGTATGTGYSVLSVPWAWPSTTVDLDRRDTAMRRCVQGFAAHAEELGPDDPVQLWRNLESVVPSVARAAAEQVDGVPEMPRLAATLALGAVDNAIHDAWSRAASRPAFSMYNREFLSQDLRWLDPALTGRYPGDFHEQPRQALPVQHVVGVGDPVEAGDAAQRPLRDWLRADGVRHLKVKVRGADPREDAERLMRIAAVADDEVGEYHLAVDPNEAYDDAATTAELLARVREIAPPVAARLRYFEQPTPRGLDLEPDVIAGTAVPVIIDEGYTDHRQLPHLRAAGWSGVAIKASKGQSSALVTHSYARAHDLFVTVQDLTCVENAFAHSARLVAGLPLSSSHLEYNSRQYVPDANAGIRAHHPDLVTVTDGHVRHPLRAVPGLVQV